MGREANMTPDYEILAFLTRSKERYLGGKPLSLLAENDEELEQLTRDIAVAMKADVIQLKTGDYLVIRV